MGRYKRRKESPIDENDAGLLRHIRSLGLTSVDEYRNWCAESGFSRKLNKTWNERCRESASLTCEIAAKRLKTRRHEARHHVQSLIDICEERCDSDELAHRHLQLLSKRLEDLDKQSANSKETRHALSKLLHIASNRRCKFFDDSAVINAFGQSRGNTFIEALVALAWHHKNWIRQPADWKPRSKNGRRQFVSLAKHLFCEYSLPNFFDSVWFLGHNEAAMLRQSWFVHLGSGGSLRSCNMPIAYTNRMRHLFMLAPNDLTIDQAIRWGQLRTLNLSDPQIRELVQLPIVLSFENDDFWISVFRWLAENPSVKPDLYGPIFDYLHNQRFVVQKRIFADGISAGPPQPNLTMKGRSVRTLVLEMNAWHHRLATDNSRFNAAWRRSGFPEFEFQEGEGESAKLWSIRELLSTKALVVEGRLMRHCVASYASRCGGGGCSIWTLEVETKSGRDKVLTLEVSKSTGRIIQARGRANRRPKEMELKILRRWCCESGLVVGVS